MAEALYDQTVFLIANASTAEQATLSLAVVAQVLASLVVTRHVLLTKREVRAAVAWIALAWLSPVIGALLYYIFGINRVNRKATRLGLRFDAPARFDATPRMTKLALPGNIARIADVGAAITGSDLTVGNALRILPKGSEVRDDMLAAIAEARQSVAVACYIFRADSVGAAFIDALSAAHARGVAVRVLIDGVGGGYFRAPVARALRMRGVPTALFLRTWRPWKMPLIHMRSHRKLLIVDGAIAFTGGMNVGEEYMSVDAPHRVVDTHARLEGPVVRQCMRVFAHDWMFTTGETLSGEAWWPKPRRTGSVHARGITSGPDEDVDKLENLLATAAVEARQRIRIVTPYFLPDRRLYMALSLAVLRRVSLEIIIPARSNYRLVDWATRAHLDELLRGGAKVYLTPAPFDHSKLMTVDGILTVFGSSNWDVRSHRLNFEFDVECYDEAQTEDIDRLLDAKISASRRLSLVDLSQRPGAVKLRDSAARLLLPYL